MSKANGKMEAVLEGYSNFLRERKLALPKHQPHLVRWVREFMTFAAKHPGYTFEQTLDMFLAALRERTGIKPWQIRQATGTPWSGAGKWVSLDCGKLDVP